MRAPFFLGLLILSAPIVQAQNAAVDALPLFLQSRVVDGDPLMDFRTQSVPQGQVDRDTGVLRAAYRLAPPVSLGVTHEATARAYLDAEVEALFQAEEDLYDGEKESVLREKLVAREYLSADDDVASGLVPTILFGSPIREGLTDDITVSVGLDAGVATADIPVEISVTDGTAKEGTDYHVTSDLDPLVILVGDSEAFASIQIQTINDNIGEGDETIVFEVSAPGLTSASQNLTITDNERVTIEAPAAMKNAGFTLTLSPDSANEDDGNINLVATVTADPPLGENTNMYLSILRKIWPGVAEYGNDYTANGLSSIPLFIVSRVLVANETQLYLPLVLTIIDDVVPEEDETITIIIALDPWFTNIILAEDFTITDDGDPPTSIALSVSPSSVAEDVGTAPVVTVTAMVDGGTFTDPQTVMVSVGTSSDRAVEGTDYGVVDDFSIVIPAGDASATGTFTLAPMDDAFTEGEETISVAGSAAVTVTATEITITDDDAASTALVLTISPDSAEEDAGTVDVGVTVSLDEDTRTEDTNITLTVLDGTATSPGDYSASSPTVTLQIPMGMTEVTGTVPIAIVSDNIAEGDEMLTLRAEATGLTSDSEDFTIEDDDTSLSVTLGVSPSSVAEDVGTAPVVTVTATVDGGTFTDPQTVMVSVGTSSDSAVEGTDYAVVDDFEIVIPAGDASATGTFTLAPMDDAFVEGEETLTVSGLLSGVTVTATELTITDDDAASTALVLTISPNSAVESAGTVDVSVTVRLDAGARTTDTDITLTVLDGTATSPGDYSASSPTVTLQIPMGMVSVTGTVPIAIVNDNIAEGDETVTLEVEATGLASDNEDFTIEDDDTSLSVTLGVSPASVAENVGTPPVVTVTATVDGGTFADPQTVMVSVGTSSDSAVEGTDYAVVDDFPIVIPAGDASATGTFTLAPMDDAFAEGQETVTVSGLLSGVPVTATELTITDDNAASTALVLTISPESAVEDAGTVDVGVTVRLDAGARTTATSVTLTVLDGTALSPGDYNVSSSSVTLQIPEGMTSVTETVPIAIVDDNIAEGDETLSIGAEATGLTSDSEDFTITDDDAAPTSIALSVSPSSVAEDVSTAQSVTVTATVEGNSRFSEAQTLTVSVGKSEDSAVEGTDYAEVDDFAIVIPAGNASATGTFMLTPMDDAFAEGEETLTVSGLLSGVTVTATKLTITDDDTESTALVVTISPEGAEEDAGTVNVGVTVRLDAGTQPLPTDITLTVSDGTALSPGDYSASSSPVTLQIPMGMVSVTGTVPIAIVDDDIAEGDETVMIAAEATGLTSDSEEFTITDDDAAPTSITLSVSPSRVAEDVDTATSVTVTATVEGSSRFSEAQTLTVSVGKSGDSAVEETDYGVVDDFPIVIPAGDASATGTFTLAPMDDAFAEGEETVTVSGLLSGVPVTATELTITDDDTESEALVLTVATARLLEDSGTSWARFRASLNGAAQPMDTPMDIRVTDGTATAGTDYSVSVISTLLTIPAGETSISDSLQITITDDDTVEGDETIVIGVSAQGLTGTTQNLMIVDDEAAVRIDVLNVIAKDDGDYTITATVRQNMGAPVASVVLHYGDGVAFEMAPMQTLASGSSSLYRAELMGPAEGGILYYYVVATNEDGLTATYPPDGRYWDISNYIAGSRLVLLDFEDGDAGDKSAVRHYVAYKGGAGALAEGALALDGLEEYAEILGSSLGASEEFALELMFNADDFDAGTLDGSGRYLVIKPAGCSTCWGEPTFSLLWGDGGNSGTYVAARFWNTRYEGEQVGLEVSMPLASEQWYHAVVEVQRDGAGRRAVLQLRDRSGLLYGEDAAVLPVGPAISRYPIFVGHIGDRGFFDGRIDDVAFYNYAHFDLLSTSIENVREVPEGYVLEQNYPNPFNPVTTIRYDLARVGHVRLEVSDLLGRRVAVLVDEVQQAGVQEMRFDARDLPSGMYLYRLRVEDFVSVKKMVLLK